MLLYRCVWFLQEDLSLGGTQGSVDGIVRRDSGVIDGILRRNLVVSRWHSKEVVGDPHFFYYFHFHMPSTSAMMLSKFSLENQLSTYCEEGNSGSRDVQDC